ncbi:MAG: class I SAM-dependent methyltransferase [Christensenellaceae bacterium]
MALSDLFATKKYNMALLKKLNKEYEHKEIMTSVTEYSDEYQINQANQRIDELSKWIDFEGMKILEIGCGGGYVSYQLSQRFSCQVIGIDIYTSEVWDRFSPLTSGVSFRNVDLSRENPFEEDEFDVILSFVAWEHIRHPFEVLQQATKILKPNGLFYILANLYRSAVASHLYKVIFFPFPHLLFEEDIVTKFALSQGTEQ